MPMTLPLDLQTQIDPDCQRILQHLPQIQSELCDNENDASLLRKFLRSKDLQLTMKMYKRLCIMSHRRMRPVTRSSVALAANTFCDVRRGSEKEARATRELLQILSMPHVQALLYTHDRVAAGEFDPVVDQETYDAATDEKTLKIVHLVKSDEPLGVTIQMKEETGAIEIARIMHGGAAHRSGLIHVGDEIFEINGVHFRGRHPDEMAQTLSKISGPVTMKLGPADNNASKFRASKTRVKTLFSYNAEEDTVNPCAEAGLSFERGDILHIISQSDALWWQAQKEGEKNQRTGLIPSSILQERREMLRKANEEDEQNSRGSRAISPCRISPKIPRSKRVRKMMYQAILNGGLIHVGDEIFEINGVHFRGRHPDEMAQTLSKISGPVTMKLGPADNNASKFRASKTRVKTLFSYNAEEDTVNPCAEAGLSFERGDILHIISQSDALWWQAQKEGEKNQRTGLIPSSILQERREMLRKANEEDEQNSRGSRAISPCRISPKIPRSKRVRKMMYQAILNGEFDHGEVPTYEEVEMYTPDPNRPRPLVLVGATHVGRNELKRRLIASNPSHFTDIVPYTSRTRKPFEEEGKEYHFISRQEMESGIIAQRYVEHGEYKGNLYGTRTETVISAIQGGKMCILCPSVQCTVNGHFPSSIGATHVGRNELKRRLIASNPSHFTDIVPYTSRTRKPFEEEGKEYHFISRQEMESGIIAQSRYVEHGEYKGNLYGTRTETVISAIQGGKMCILCPSVQAIKSLRSAEIKPYIIFIKPPVLEKLKETRQKQAASITLEDGDTRLCSNEDFENLIEASEKMEDRYGYLFDCSIVNQNLHLATNELLKVAHCVETEETWVPASWIQ
ncbi:MAGUK p55 subfamily member 7-like [Pecten maximus]|uniref:MAGUK p55 subfamily member 7-like n=1 Tax=Pecten maximus TaxID=6579 RepID=UPI001458B038|nr:MAGUK p55 subfamily member 7-like [Pecten maximus]